MFSFTGVSKKRLLAAAATACTLAWCDSESERMPADVNSYTSTVINAFSSNFAKEVDDGENNSVSSGLSAGLVLGLVALGSFGQSREELLVSLEFPNILALRIGLSDVATQLQEVEGVIFNMANKVYLKSGSKLKPDFKSVVEDDFHAEVELISFDDGGETAANIINTWAESKTNNKIKDLTNAESFSDRSHIVLVNALYFKGRWKTQFDSKETNITKFRVDSSKTSEVPFMRISRRFRYSESKSLNAKLVELPFEGEEASMLVVLPNAADGLTELLHKLANTKLLEDELTNMTINAEVCVCLPKFKIETDVNTKEVLPKLGVENIFHQDMVDNMAEERLYVSNAIQKALIEVDEEGAEPAADNIPSPRPPPFKIRKHVVADHPFLAVVKIGDYFAFWAAVRDPLT